MESATFCWWASAFVAAVGRPGDLIGPDDAVLHGQEAIELIERQTEQGEEDLRRVRDGELRGEVDLAPLDETVDEIVDQDGHLLLHRRH